MGPEPTWHWVWIMIDADSAIVIITNDLGRSRLKCFLRCHTTLYLICMYCLYAHGIVGYTVTCLFLKLYIFDPHTFLGGRKIGKTCSEYLKECKISIFYFKDDIWIFICFFHFFDNSRTPGGQMQKSIFLKCCTLIDFMIRYKFVIHSVSELWTAKMIFGLFFDFSIFWQL